MGLASFVMILCCADFVCPVTGSPGAGNTCSYRWSKSHSNRRPVSPNEGWDPFTMSSKCSGSVTTSSAGSCSSDRATDTADIGSNFPTHVLHDRTTSSALGLIIRTFAEHVDAFTNVCPTTTPKSSVNCREGTINAQSPDLLPIAGRFVDQGRHDCRASVPNNPSEPMLATTQHITHFSPGKTTSNSSSPITVNGEESADTNRRAQGRILDLTCGSAHTSFRTPT